MFGAAASEIGASAWAVPTEHSVSKDVKELLERACTPPSRTTPGLHGLPRPAAPAVGKDGVTQLPLFEAEGGHGAGTDEGEFGGEAYVSDPWIRSRLHAALRDRKFELKFQPIVNLTTGVAVAVEVLARWRHPAGGFINPARFIPIAEETGAIAKLGEFVLHEACQRVGQHWQNTGVLLGLHVNVSVAQLRCPNFTAIVQRALADARLPAALLTLELTESVFANPGCPQKFRVLAGLKALGVRLAVDDFGTGYSCLAYLSQLPLDCIKIDRAFVSAAGAPCRSAWLVSSFVITLGLRLGLEVVAEGVESTVQANMLRKLGCTLAQGFLFGRAGQLTTLRGKPIQATDFGR